jgi:protein-disulfide isomerase
MTSRPHPLQASRPATLETQVSLHYNLRVSNARISGHFVFAVLCASLLTGLACEKKPNKSNDTGAMTALDSVGQKGSAAPGSAATPESANDNSPLAGIDTGKLDADKTQVFYKLVGSLKSPCGKAHSLRTSFTSDTTCKRAPFAVRYVLSLLEDEVSEDVVREAYTKKYDPAKKVTFDTSKAPHVGTDDARIKLVEFYDYECPHCQAFKPGMEQVVADKAGQVSVYFMMFPIESRHPDSRSAAQAALAANALGKFKEMHDKLFEETPRHSRDNVLGYAKALGLDPAKFQKAYDDASGQVTNDLKQGENAGVDSTPTLFFNDRKYEGPMHPKYIEMWIDEELAVNR